jgi:hypothetical protein
MWTSLKAGWAEATCAPSRSVALTNSGELRNVKTVLAMRLTIGLIGLLMPGLVLLGTWQLPRRSGEPILKGSLSAYFYSGMSVVFIGSLWAIAILLILYQMFGPRFENVVSAIAGAAVLLVTFFPTNVPKDGGSLTPIQRHFTKSSVADIHYASAGVFILMLALLCAAFAVKEGRRTELVGRMKPEFWRAVHSTCAAMIVVALMFIVVYNHWHLHWGSWLDDHSVWLGEVVATASFGITWFSKGWEIRRL